MPEMLLDPFTAPRLAPDLPPHILRATGSQHPWGTVAASEAIALYGLQPDLTAVPDATPSSQLVLPLDIRVVSAQEMGRSFSPGQFDILLSPRFVKDRWPITMTLAGSAESAYSTFCSAATALRHRLESQTSPMIQRRVETNIARLMNHHELVTAAMTAGPLALVEMLEPGPSTISLVALAVSISLMQVRQKTADILWHIMQGDKKRVYESLNSASQHLALRVATDLIQCYRPPG